MGLRQKFGYGSAGFLSHVIIPGSFSHVFFISHEKKLSCVRVLPTYCHVMDVFEKSLFCLFFVVLAKLPFIYVLLVFVFDPLYVFPFFPSICFLPFIYVSLFSECLFSTLYIFCSCCFSSACFLPFIYVFFLLVRFLVFVFYPLYYRFFLFLFFLVFVFYPLNVFSLFYDDFSVRFDDFSVWIGLDRLRFGMDRGYGSACGFRVWIGLYMLTRSQMCIYMGKL